MGAIAAAGIGAAGALGSAMIGGGKGSGGSSSGATTSTPWGPQQPYMLQGFQNAQNIYNQDAATGPYTGNYVAGNNPVQNGAVYQAAAYGQTAGSWLPYITGGTAQSLQQGAAPEYLATARGIAGNGIGAQNPESTVLAQYGLGNLPANTSINPALNGALTQAGINGANSLGGFTNAQNQVIGESLADPTTGLIGDASAYMNAAPVQQAINSTNAQLQQQLHEQTVPGLNREAEMGGSLNSSRAGMAEGMANEGEAIAQGNADSQILNNAYNTGLNTAATERNAGLTTAMYGANSGLVDNANIAQGQNAALTGQGEFATNTAVNALNSGLNYGLNYQNADTNAALAANAQLGNAVGMGINGATQANGQAASDFGLYSAGGALAQQGQQADLTNAYDQWQMQTQYPWQNLDNYWNIVGHPEGTSGTTSQQSTLPPNYLGNAAGGAAAGAGLFNQFNQNNNNNNSSSGPVTSSTDDPYANYTNTAYNGEQPYISQYNF